MTVERTVKSVFLGDVNRTLCHCRHCVNPKYCTYSYICVTTDITRLKCERKFCSVMSANCRIFLVDASRSTRIKIVVGHVMYHVSRHIIVS